jgi:hypothetical protein
MVVKYKRKKWAVNEVLALRLSHYFKENETKCELQTNAIFTS